MEITWVKGNKSSKDRILLITTKEKEPFSIYKLCVLINQLSINEQNIRVENNYTKNYFEPAIQECLQMSEMGADWAEYKNKDLVLKWCKKHHLKFEKIEIELQKIIQRRVDDYGIS